MSKRSTKAHRRRHQSLQVFLSCPGDMVEEVETIRRVVDDINSNEGPSARRPYVLGLRHWKSHTYSSAGDPPIEAISKQLKYDIFVGVMGGRFGEPTPTSASGTQEELDRALPRAYRGEATIGFYFKNVNFYLHDENTDVNQLRMVREFRDRLSAQQVYYQIFKTQDDLYRLVHRKLTADATQLLEPKPVRPRRRPSRRQNIERKRLPDWQALSNINFPQGATYKDLEIPALRFRQLSIRGKMQSSSSYFRFGFKLMTSNAPRVVGEGSIQTADNNIVIHIYRDLYSSNLLFASYHSGRRDQERADPVILDYPNCPELSVALTVSHECIASLSVGAKCVYQEPISPEIVNRIYAFAWGDGHKFQVYFRNIEWEVSWG